MGHPVYHYSNGTSYAVLYDYESIYELCTIENKYKSDELCVHYTLTNCNVHRAIPLEIVGGFCIGQRVLSRGQKNTICVWGE